MIVKDMYHQVSTKVRNPAETSNEFDVKVGVHQGSALSPLLFNIVMNYLTSNLQRAPPWDILYADDVVIISEDVNNLQQILKKLRKALETTDLSANKQREDRIHALEL